MAPHAMWLGSLLVAVAVGGAGLARADAGGEREALARLGRRSVFLAHQSVGMSVLDGLSRLAAERGVPLRIAEAPAGAAIPAGTLGHAWVGENGRPASKLEAFARALDALPAPGVDVALVKLCYVDFDPDTDAAALFASYQATLAGLRRRHPRTAFVHVTAPLTTVQGGAKGWVKRLLGRSPWGLAENARREAYNALLREAYLGREPLFDLARLESTGPDGTAETAAWQRRAAPALVPAYSSDGGHLNLEGQARAARALLEVLAAISEPGEAPPAAAGAR